jgi:hypothetical protein
MGVEPIPPFEERILSPLRLPFRHVRLVDNSMVYGWAFLRTIVEPGNLCHRIATSRCNAMRPKRAPPSRRGATLVSRLFNVLGMPRRLGRDCAVRPPRLNEASFRIKGWGCLAAILLAIAGLCDANVAVAADANDGGAHRFAADRSDRTVPPAARRGIAARPSEMPAGVVVLRGSRPAIPPPYPNVGEPTPGGEGYGSTDNGPPDVAAAPGGVDLGNVGGYDFSGLDPPVTGVFTLDQ